MNADQKAFFQLVKEAITLNPFSSERMQVDRKLADTSQNLSNDILFERVDYRLTKAINTVLEVSDQGSGLDSEERILLRYAQLFRIFYEYCDDYDQLIRDQIKEPEITKKVAFAKEVIKKLVKSGFDQEEALRFFALFFQMRRGFFFIQRIAGQSRCVYNLRKNLWNNIFTNNIELYENFMWNRMEDFSTMLLGETGTGKGLAAKAIGRSGFIPYDQSRGCFTESFAKSFVSINLSQFPEQLIESELFGHRKGAFTGAVEAHNGIFSRCSPHGSIFLDEIGDVSIPVQIKLLQVLQERRFSPVGGHSVERFQGRVIAATNQPISEMRKKGKFRDDFYYRLCSDVINIPSLKDRLDENPDEIEIILPFIIKRILGRDSQEIVQEITSYIAENKPENYHWPGNIRELEQCARQLLLRWDYNWQTDPDQNRMTADSIIEEGKVTAQELLSYYCSRLYDRLGTYGAVAKVTDLDRRTVKKYVTQTRTG